MSLKCAYVAYIALYGLWSDIGRGAWAVGWGLTFVFVCGICLGGGVGWGVPPYRFRYNRGGGTFGGLYATLGTLILPKNLHRENIRIVTIKNQLLHNKP